MTLLFSTEQYLAAADAYLKGIERRIADGLSPNVASVASLFLSRWDVAVADEVPDELKNKLGVAVGRNAYVAYRELLASDRMQRLENWGARPQRLLYASTGTKDPDASETLYIEGLASANTVNTMPEKTLLATGEGADFSAGPDTARRRRLRRGARQVRRRRHPSRRARRAPPGGGQGVVQQVLERARRVDRRRSREGRDLIGAGAVRLAP